MIESATTPLPSRKLKILLISYRFPWPWTRGDTLTVGKMCEYFGARHDLDLLCGQQAPDPADEERVEPYVHQLKTLPFSRLGAALRTGMSTFTSTPFQIGWCSSSALMREAAALNAERKYDVVIAYYIRTAEAAAQLVGPKKVVAMQLSLALQWQRAAKHAKGPLRRFLSGVEAARLRRYEESMFTRFDRCLIISPHDLKGLSGVQPDKVIYNPHGVDTEKYRPQPEVAKEPGMIVFSGNMGFQPNEDAVCYFVESIFPRVLASAPDARFVIVGKDPTRKVQALTKHPRVEVTGTVQKVEAYLNRAEVGVDPLRIGGGLQNKVLEGMSMGLPMVVSTVANEGIGAPEGEGLFMADEPDAFADRVVELLRDASLRERTSVAARTFIQSYWTWEYHFQRLENELIKLVSSTS